MHIESSTDQKTAISKIQIEQLANGSHEAFSQIYIHCHRQLFLLALRYLKSKEMAEDAVQYTFMRLWETRQAIDPGQGVEPYLYGILKNYLLNTYKHQQMQLEKKEEIILNTPLFTEETVLHSIYKKQREEALIHALALLPPQRKLICELKIIEGLSNPEIAEKLGISINTVKVQYYKSIIFLRNTLKNQDFIIVLIISLSQYLNQ